MATRRPIVMAGGKRKQLPPGDVLPKAAIPFGGRVYIGDLPPDDAVPNDGWLSSVDGAFAVLYDDGTSTQWVVSSGPAGPRGPAGADGAKGDKGDTGATGSPGDPAAATLSISNQTAASTLPATGAAVGMQAFLQTARNCLRWLVANFDSSGKANDALKWDGANKTISTSAPSGGADGDIWFQREA